MTLLLYVIKTDNGTRFWHAEDEQHAIEQHNDSFLKPDDEGSLEYEPGEQIRYITEHGVSPYDESVYEDIPVE